MKVVLALIADYVNVSQEGKLNILGIFDRISASGLPVIHPQMQLIMTLEADRSEAEREHKLEIELIDMDGNKLFSVTGNLKFGPPPPGEKVKLNHILQFNNLKFEKFGTYEFKILINNEVRSSIPFSVVERKS